jgi:hypothetical protein
MLSHRLMRSQSDHDRISSGDSSGAQDLGQNPLPILFHAGAKALANRVHLGAGLARFPNQEKGFADLDLLSQEKDQVNPLRFDISSNRTGWNLRQTQGSGMPGNLFALDQGDLANGRLAGSVALAAKVTVIASDTHSGNGFEGVHIPHDRSRLAGVQMQ